MSEWQSVLVDDIKADIPNAIVGGPFGSNLVSRDYVDEGIPVIRGSNMGQGRWVSGPFAHVSEEKAEELSGNAARPGDLIFTQRGTLGQVCLVPDGPHDRYIVSQSQMKLTANPSKANALFLYYVFCSPSQQHYIQQNAIQTGVPHTNLGILRETPLEIPSLSQQQRIAHILGTLDDKIEMNRRMNRTLEAIAQAIFKSWFIDFDPVIDNAILNGKLIPEEFAGRAAHRAKLTHGKSPLPEDIRRLFPDEFQDSELGPIPKGWKTGTLGDVAEYPRRGVRPDQIDPETPYIALEHMPKQCIALSNWDTANELESNKFEFKQGEILFGKLRPYFHKVGIAPVDGVCSTDIVVVKPRQDAWFGFVLGHLSSTSFVDYTTAGSTGTKMPRTNWKEMARYPVVIPPVHVAEAFTEQVKVTVDRIIATIHESRTLAALRDVLLPKLISGEILGKDAKAFLKERRL